MILFLLALTATLNNDVTNADIDRSDENFHAEFSVIKIGRLLHHTVLMFLHDIDMNCCLDWCVKFLSCKTFSYHFEAQLCELNDREFNKMDAYKEAKGWQNYATPAKVHGGFGNWITITPCVCGEAGIRRLIRICDNPPPRHGGQMCVGETEKTEPCANQPCNVTAGGSSCIFQIGNGVGQADKYVGDQKGKDCFKACLVEKSRDPSVNGVTRHTDLNKGGCWCEKGMTGRADSIHYTSCFIEPIINGGWGAWSFFSTCSVSCGGGARTRERHCKDPQPSANGGLKCETGKGARDVVETEQINCNEQVCPVTANGLICDFKTGDGVGWGEQHVGYFQNREDCFKKCLTMKKIKENINGVTWFPTGATRGCWCEISMKKIKATSDYTTCFIETNDQYRRRVAKSTAGITQLTINFINKHSRAVHIFWKDYEGKQKIQYFGTNRCETGQLCTIDTFSTHQYIAEDAETKQLVHFTNGPRTDVIAGAVAFGASAAGSQINLDIVT